jgi:hypothetical protein
MGSSSVWDPPTLPILVLAAPAGRARGTNTLPSLAPLPCAAGHPRSVAPRCSSPSSPSPLAGRAQVRGGEAVEDSTFVDDLWTADKSRRRQAWLPVAGTVGWHTGPLVSGGGCTTHGLVWWGRWCFSLALGTPPTYCREHWQASSGDLVRSFVVGGSVSKNCLS